MKYDRSPDKEMSFKKDYTIKCFKKITEDKGGPIETYVLYDGDGREIAKLVKKDGELRESSATTDAQESGLFADFAKKFSIKEEDLIYTQVGAAAAQMVVEEDKGVNDLKKAAPKYTEDDLSAHSPGQGLVHKLKNIKALNKSGKTLDYKKINAVNTQPESEARTIDYSKLTSPERIPKWKQKSVDKQSADRRQAIKQAGGVKFAGPDTASETFRKQRDVKAATPKAGPVHTDEEIDITPDLPKMPPAKKSLAKAAPTGSHPYPTHPLRIGTKDANQMSPDENAFHAQQYASMAEKHQSPYVKKEAIKMAQHHQNAISSGHRWDLDKNMTAGYPAAGAGLAPTTGPSSTPPDPMTMSKTKRLIKAMNSALGKGGQSPSGIKGLLNHLRGGLNKADQIPGGLADKKKVNDFDPKKIAQGVQVELEHTSDQKIAEEIAMDHLTEDPSYYDKLAGIEGGDLEKADFGEIAKRNAENKKRMASDRAKANQSVMRSHKLTHVKPASESPATKKERNQGIANKLKENLNTENIQAKHGKPAHDRPLNVFGPEDSGRYDATHGEGMSHHHAMARKLLDQKVTESFSNGQPRKGFKAAQGSGHSFHLGSSNGTHYFQVSPDTGRLTIQGRIPLDESFLFAADKSGVKHIPNEFGYIRNSPAKGLPTALAALKQNPTYKEMFAKRQSNVVRPKFGKSGELEKGDVIDINRKPAAPKTEAPEGPSNEDSPDRMERIQTSLDKIKAMFAATDASNKPDLEKAQDVKKQGKGYNPYAVCNASLKKAMGVMRKDSNKTAILSD